MIVSAFQIIQIDPHDEPSLRQWWQTGHAAGAERPYDFFPAWEVNRVSMPRHNPEMEVILLGAFDHHTMVGSALMHLPKHDNTHMAYADVLVPQLYRRRGVGTALLEAVESRSREGGRKYALVEASTPPDRGSAGTEFGAVRGYTVGNVEEMKVLDLADCEHTWDALEREVAERVGDYRIVTWGTETPEEYLPGFCDLLSVFMSQIPLGDVPLEDGHWTPERVHANEQRARDIGREPFVAAAIAPDGTVAGVSDVRVNLADKRVAQIGITIVSAGHRGHRLGLAMKLATHRALRAAHPECELVVTSNAGVNQHMNTVNEKLGYRVVERLLELQKEL